MLRCYRPTSPSSRNQPGPAQRTDRPDLSGIHSTQCQDPLPKRISSAAVDPCPALRHQDPDAAYPNARSSNSQDGRPKDPEAANNSASKHRPFHTAKIRPLDPRPTARFAPFPARVRKTCYSVGIMQFQPPIIAQHSPEKTPVPAPNAHFRKKIIGGHWTTLGDIGGLLSPLSANWIRFRTLMEGSRNAAR